MSSEPWREEHSNGGNLQRHRGEDRETAKIHMPWRARNMLFTLDSTPQTSGQLEVRERLPHREWRSAGEVRFILPELMYSSQDDSFSVLKTRKAVGIPTVFTSQDWEQ